MTDRTNDGGIRLSTVNRHPAHRQGSHRDRGLQRHRRRDRPQVRGGWGIGGGQLRLQCRRRHPRDDIHATGSTAVAVQADVSDANDVARLLSAARQPNATSASATSEASTTNCSRVARTPSSVRVGLECSLSARSAQLPRSPLRFRNEAPPTWIPLMLIYGLYSLEISWDVPGPQ
jgi:hypothetical protein